jgi:hypothetical protein
VTTTTWDQPAWAHIEATGPGLPGLMGTLQATTAACDAAIGLGQVTPAIDPFTGWATTTGILAGLILATHTTAPPDLGPLDTPPSDDAAAAVVDRLYRTAADQVLSLTLEVRDQLAALDYDQRAQATTSAGVPARPLLRALSTAMAQLADSYTETFARLW